MFGMEKKANKNPEDKTDHVFDLEKEIVSNPKNYDSLKEKIQGRVQELKTALRSGSDQEHFDRYGLLLHGFVALKKVLERVKEEKK